MARQQSFFLILALCAQVLLIHGHEGCPFSHDHENGHHHDTSHWHNHDDHEISPSEHGHSHKHHDHDTHVKLKLPEEIAEEEDLALYGFKSHRDVERDRVKQPNGELSSLGLWMYAMGSSLLVSMASLICLIILPFIVSQGKPSKTFVDSLAAFGGGAMLGDAFLHQLPHAFGQGASHSSHHSHSHPHEVEHHHHAHSIQDLSVGLSVLAGIILFFVIEKIVRRVEELSTSSNHSALGHHHHKKQKARSTEIPEEHKKDGARLRKPKAKLEESEANGKSKLRPEEKERNENSMANEIEDVQGDEKLKEKFDVQGDEKLKEKFDGGKTGKDRDHSESNLVLGYLNLFSDGVHNFTDGMALGAAFLLHGRVGGWSRTVFLLAHELPQEVGDFGILVRSGFSVFKALAFNFLSALVALAGTAMALVIGGTSGHSSLIEGFTAGGFIYISVAGVLPEMHQQGNSLKNAVVQLLSLGTGIFVAICISILE